MLRPRPIYPNKPIFETFPSRGRVTTANARDGYELAEAVKYPDQRKDIYEMLGMDGDAVDKYLLTVEYLDRCFKKAAYQKPKHKAFLFW